MSDVKEKIESQIRDNKVILYMKGNREMPRCGGSASGSLYHIGRKT